MQDKPFLSGSERGWAFRNLRIIYSVFLRKPLLSSLDSWHRHVHRFLCILWYKLRRSPVFSPVSLRFSFLVSAESAANFLPIFWLPIVCCYCTVSCFSHSHGSMPLKKIPSLYYYRCLERVKVVVCVQSVIFIQTLPTVRYSLLYCMGKKPICRLIKYTNSYGIKDLPSFSY